MHSRIPSLVFGLATLCVANTLALAQVVITPLTPQIGSSNPASPEPPVPKPSTKPCSVTLLNEQAFADFTPKPINYTPPAACKGPWAKVVFTADFTVSAGRQYDRTATFFLGTANIYFGTTAEPRAKLSPSWHVERDVTDLSSIFQHPQTGQANLGNFVGTYNGVVYNGIVYANAHLLFYPADAANPAPEVPSAAIGFPANNTDFLNTTADQSVGTYTFPRNLERLYLDVISQSQSLDEQWFDCFTNDIAATYGNCGNGAFRETEVTVDGKPAGVAPVYPWIYTGGIDPYLWEPIPGLETLNLKPYRVDLTPFVGMLTDGKQHSVAVSVFHADYGFSVASTLLLYTGPVGSVTTGSLLQDSLAPEPTPSITDYLSTAADGTVSGPIYVTSNRQWIIAGYINTSHGRIDTTINASNSFSNTQTVKLKPDYSVYDQGVSQQSTQTELITTKTNTGTTATQHIANFPINVTSNLYANSQGGYNIDSNVRQTKYEAFRSPLGANSPNPVVTNEVVTSQDTLYLNSGFSIIGHANDQASATYAGKDAFMRCIYRQLESVGVVLTGAQDSTSCSYAP